MVISHHLRYSIYTIIYLFDDSKSQVLKNQGAAINTSVVYPSFHHRCCIFFVIEHDSSSIVPCRTPHFRSVSATLGKLWWKLVPIGSMVLVYMLTFGVLYIDGIHVTIYSSTMDPMGYRCDKIHGVYSKLIMLIYLHGSTSFPHRRNAKARHADLHVALGPYHQPWGISNVNQVMISMDY